MIIVGRIVNSRNFAQANGFTIYRQTGNWVSGRWVANPETPVQAQGTVTVADTQDLDQVPEGDRIKGVMCFHSQQPIYTTRAASADPGGTSDEIVWKGDRYRIASIEPWIDFGYYKAIGVRMVSE